MAESLILVGLGRVELPTSPLSGVRSSHLSYRPGFSPKASWSSARQLLASSHYPLASHSGSLVASSQQLDLVSRKG
jgi:hypothetical protein